MFELGVEWAELTGDNLEKLLYWHFTPILRDLISESVFEGSLENGLGLGKGCLAGLPGLFEAASQCFHPRHYPPLLRQRWNGDFQLKQFVFVER